MSDVLKDYINNNRESFDDLEPGEVWSGIDKSINEQTTNQPQGKELKSASFQKIITMIKYGFGASALILATFLIMHSQKKKMSSSDMSPASVIKDSVSATALLPEKGLEKKIFVPIDEKKGTENKNQQVPLNPNLPLVAETRKNDLIFTDSTVAEELIPLQKQKAPLFFVNIPVKKDSVITEGYTLVDTLFSGIKKLDIRMESCDVNIRAVKGDRVTVNGKLDNNAGSFIVLGRTSYKRTECILRFEKKDSVLLVWMESRKINKRMATKNTKEKGSVLNFDVPVEMQVEALTNSGDLKITGLKNDSMTLKTSFGNIYAENVLSNLKLKSSSGNITLQTVTGNIKANSSFGKQLLENIIGDIKSNASSGDIILKEVRGNIEVTSSFGSQICENIVGNITITSSSGAVKIKHLNGNIIAHSSFGKQIFENINGDINSTASSGNISITDLKGKLNLGTNFGNITGTNITLVNNSEFKTSSGNIQISLLNDMKELSFDLKSSSGKLLVEKNNFKNSSNDKLSMGQGSILVKGISNFGDQSYK